MNGFEIRGRKLSAPLIQWKIYPTLISKALMFNNTPVGPKFIAHGILKKVEIELKLIDDSFDWEAELVSHEFPDPLLKLIRAPFF